MKIKVKIKVFLIIMVAVSIFAIFGGNNVVVGIGAVITAATMFGEDYTADLSTTTILLVIINVFIGIFAYLASLNPFCGLVLTLVLSFIIYYLFSYDAKPMKSIGFITTYLSLIFSPILLSDLPVRLVALAFSGVIIMLLYCILSKHNFDTVVNKDIIAVIDEIKGEIDLILSEQTIADQHKSINIKMHSIELKIYERMESSKTDLRSVYLKELFIVLCRRINAALLSIKKKESNITLLENTKTTLENIRLYIANGKSLENLKTNLEKCFDNMEIVTAPNDIDIYNCFTLKSSIGWLNKSIENIEAIKGLYANERIKLLKAIKKNVYGSENNFKMNSLRLNLAVKAAVLFSSAVFIVDYFHIYEGQWIVYAISIFLLPYTEQSNKKVKSRLVGTTIGVILFGILYLLIHGHAVLLAVALFIAMYFSMFTASYTIKCIFITFTAILGVKIMVPHSLVFVLLEDRVLFTLIGAIFTAVFMNMFFPYKLKNDIKNTAMNFMKLNQSVLTDLETEKIEKEKLETILLTGNYFWRRMNYINKDLKSDDIESLLIEQSNFITDVNLLFSTGNYLTDNAAFVQATAKSFNANSNVDDLGKKAQEIFYSAANDSERFIMINLYKIYADFQSINLLSERIIAGTT